MLGNSQKVYVFSLFVLIIVLSVSGCLKPNEKELRKDSEKKMQAISYKATAPIKSLPKRTGRLLAPEYGAYIGTWSQDLTRDMSALSHFQQLGNFSVKIDYLGIFMQRVDGTLQNLDEPLALTASGPEIGPSPLELMKLRAEAGIVTALQIHVPDGNVDQAFADAYRSIPENIRQQFGLKAAIPKEKRIWMQDILDGKYDDYFLRAGLKLKEFGYPVMFEILNEFDLDFYAYGFGQDGKTHSWDVLNGAGFFEKIKALVLDFQKKHKRDPYGPSEIGLEDFRKTGEELSTAYGSPKIPDGIERVRDTWRHVHDIFDEVGASNVTWYSHAGGTRGGRIAEQPLALYWPGDNYMDWAGSSSYIRDGKHFSLDESVLPWYQETAESAWGQHPLIMHELSQIFPERPESLFQGKENLVKWIETLFAKQIPQSLPRVKAFFLIYNNFGPLDTWGRDEIAALRKNISQNPYYASALRFTEDCTAPGRISDLSAQVSEERLKLSWTAPGDDENLGRVSRYIIKYRTERISSSGGVEKDFLKEPWRLWSAQDTFEISNPPEPLQPKTKQEMVIENIKPGTYWFAIQSIDDVPYNSKISNVIEVVLPERR